jgi:fucose permease
MACGSLVYLALVSPPASAWWRAAGLLVLGAAAGMLNMGLFQAISCSYHADAAGAVTKGGLWYGVGCLAASLVAIGAFYGYNVTITLALMAVAPVIFAAVYYRSSYAVYASSADAHSTWRQAFADFRSLGAVLFALLLFFQSGNEWSLAGWLPLFLIRRVGMSPEGALRTLALYWIFLMGGRLGAIAILPRVRHGRLLLGSVLSALFGCLILYSTKTGFGAVSAVLFLGAGYASVYPLVSEAIGRRFPYYHPGFFNGIFSLALLGGLLAPATLGYAANQWGVGVVVGIPLLGTFMVMILILAIWLETKVTGR